LAKAALEQLQIAHLAERPVGEISSGEARCLLIARALVHRPKALLFDEPSNSLDVFARHSLRQAMSSLAKFGVGIILVTHDLGDIVPEVSRVVLMSKGKIVADGSKEEMLTAVRLKELFGMDVEVARQDGYYHLG
jgi:iron complex transport system ATP-binding protein